MKKHTESSIAELTAPQEARSPGQSWRDDDSRAQKASRLSLGFVCPSWPVSDQANGIVSYYTALVPALEALGCRVTILTYANRGDRPDKRVISIMDAKTRPHPGQRLLDAVGARINRATGWERPLQRALVESIHRAVDERGIELVQMEESFGWAREVMRGAPIPVCLRLHGPWFLNGAAIGAADDVAYRRRIAAEGAAIRAARFVTAPSLDVLERVRAYYQVPLHGAAVIPSTAPMPPDQERWRLDQCDRNRVLFVGRFDRMKGGDLIIDAFARVVRDCPSAQLWFVGPDADFRSSTGDRIGFVDYLEQRIPHALDSGRVVWLGRRPLADVRRLRARSMVTAICSRYETFSNTTLEAAVAGCPIVAADIGGIPSIIEDGRGGLLYQPGDATELAEKLLTLLNDPALAARLGRNARADALARLRPRIVAQRNLDYFRRVIASHAAHPLANPS